MADASRDQNFVPTLLAASSSDGTTPVKVYADPSTHRLLVDLASGSGTVTDVSVVSANGFAGTVATSTTTPAITLSTTVNAPALAGNGTAISAATTTGSGSTVVLATSPALVTPDLGTPTTLVGTNITGTAAGLSIGGTAAVGTAVTVADETTDTSCFLSFVTAATGNLGIKSNANMTFNSNTGVATFASTVLTTTDINGGTIDGTTIGATSATTIVGTTITANTSFLPDADGGAALGSATLGFSILGLASASTINWANGNAVLTHSSGILTVSTGDLRVTTAGSNSASVVTVGGTQTLTAKTLTSPTVTTATLSGAQQLAEGASIRLDQTLSADGTYSGTTIAGTAGTTLAFGDLVYLAAADSRWELTDADSSTTAGNVLMGFCVLAAASDGDPTVILLDGNIRADAAFPALTIGAPVYASTTPGDIQVAQPSGTDDVIQVVGFALTADSIVVRISPDYITHI